MGLTNSSTGSKLLDNDKNKIENKDYIIALARKSKCW